MSKDTPIIKSGQGFGDVTPTGLPKLDPGPDNKIKSGEGFTSIIDTAQTDLLRADPSMFPRQGDLGQVMMPQEGGLAALESRRADDQRWYQYVGKGFLNMGTRFGAEVAKMIPAAGLAIGESVDQVFGSSITEGKGYAQTFEQSAFLNYVDDLTEDLQKAIPLYERDRNKHGGFTRTTLMNPYFYATQGADALGFAASFLTPGLAIKALKVGAGSQKLINKGISLVSKGDKTGIFKGLSPLSKAGSNIDIGVATGMATFLEAQSEARESMKGLREKLVAEGGYTDQQIDEMVAKVGRDVFVANSAILLGPNILTNKILLGTFKGMGVGARQAYDVAGDGVKSSVKHAAKTGANRYMNIAKDLGLGIFSESYEELSQSATASFYEDQAMAGTDESFLKSPLKNYLESLNTLEGQQAVFLGALMGGLMGAGGAYVGNKNRNKRDEMLLQAMNTNFQMFSSTMAKPFKTDAKGEFVTDENGNKIIDEAKVAENLKGLGAMQTYSQLLDEAARTNNEHLYNEVFNQMFTELAIPYTMVDGGKEILKQQVSGLLDILNISKQRLENAGDVKLDTRNTQLEGLMRKFDQVKEYTDIFEGFAQHNIDSLDRKGLTDEEFNAYKSKAAISFTRSMVNMDTAKESIVREDTARAKMESAGIQTELPFVENHLSTILERNREVANTFLDAAKTQKHFDRYAKSLKAEEKVREVLKEEVKKKEDEVKVEKEVKKQAVKNRTQQKASSEVPENWRELSAKEIKKLPLKVRRKIKELKAEEKEAAPKGTVLQRARKLEVSTPRDAALQYFVNGGRITKESLTEVFGKGKPISGENKAKSSLIRTEAKGGMTPTQIAHKIWEETGLDEQEVLNEILDILQGFNNPTEMAGELLDKHEEKGVNEHGEKLFDTPFGKMTQTQIDEYTAIEREKEDPTPPEEVFEELDKRQQEYEQSLQDTTQIQEQQGQATQDETPIGTEDFTEGGVDVSDYIIPEEQTDADPDEGVSEHIIDEFVDEGKDDTVSKIIGMGDDMEVQRGQSGVTFTNIDPEFPIFLRNFRSKEGMPVHFTKDTQYSDRIGISEKIDDFIEKGRKGELNTKDKKWLYDNIAIAAIVKGLQAPISIPTTERDQEFRKILVDLILEGNDIESISSVIAWQETPDLNTINSFTNNVMDLEYVMHDVNKINLVKVNRRGNLYDKNNQPVKSPPRDITKSGSIYLEAKHYNGSTIYISLDTRKINPNEAGIIAELFQALMDQNRVDRLGELPEATQAIIQEELKEELDTIGKNFETLPILELIDFLVFMGPSPVEHNHMEYNIRRNELTIGDKTIKGEISKDQLSGIANFLIGHKFRKVSFHGKGADNVRNQRYVRHLVTQKILTTNVVTDGPMFIGGANLQIDIMKVKAGNKPVKKEIKTKETPLKSASKAQVKETKGLRKRGKSIKEIKQERYNAKNSPITPGDENNVEKDCNG